MPDYKIVNSSSFTDAISAISTIVFAYAGTPAFFSIASEMRDPSQYNRALILCQSVVTGFYLAIGIVIYYYCGSYVSSPALGSAGPTVKIVSYGFALPGLLVSTLLFIHVGFFFLFLFPWFSLIWRGCFSCANGYIDYGQVFLCPHPTRLPSFGSQHHDSLGGLAWLHLRRCFSCLYYCQCNSCFQRSRLARWCPAWHSDVFPANGRHVVV